MLLFFAFHDPVVLCKYLTYFLLDIRDFSHYNSQYLPSLLKVPVQILPYAFQEPELMCYSLYDHYIALNISLLSLGGRLVLALGNKSLICSYCSSDISQRFGPMTVISNTLFFLYSSKK